MLKYCFTVLFLVLQARGITVLPPDGSNLALRLQFILQNNAGGQELEEVECKNSGLNFCIQDPLVQLAKLQDTVNVTFHFLNKESMEKVDAVLIELVAVNSSVPDIDSSIHLLSNNLSQINNSVLWSGKLLISAQESMLTLEQLLTTEFQRTALETDRLRSKAVMTTLGLKKASVLQEDAIALLEAVNVSTFEVVATRIQAQYGLFVLNTSLLQDGEDAYSSVTKFVNVTLNDATVVLQLSEQHHCEATYTLTNITTLMGLLDTISRGLIGTISLETAVNSSNAASVLRETMETVVAFQNELEMSRPLNQSVQKEIHTTETSLAITLNSLTEIENILNEASELLMRNKDLSVDLVDLNRELTKQLREHVASVDQIEQQAIMLFDQKELLLDLAEGSGIFDCPTEFDRLAKTQSVANNAVILSEKLVETLDITIPAIVEQVTGVEESVKLLTVLVNTAGESLSDHLLRMDAIIQIIAKRRAKLDERKKSLEVVNQTIIQTSRGVEQIEMQIGLLEEQTDDVWRSFFTSSIRIERAKMLGRIVETFIEGIPRSVEEAESFINSTKPKFETVEALQLEVRNGTGLLNDSLPAVESSLAETERIVEEAELSVQTILSFLNTNNVPLRIQDGIVLAMDVNQNATNESQELRSVSLTVELEEVQDSILLHLTNLLDSVDQNTSLTVGVLNGSLVAAFVQTQQALAADVVQLIISEPAIQPFTEYKIDATRTANNIHLLLKEMKTGLIQSESATSSARLAFYFRVGFLQNAELYVGGTIRDSNIENTPFFSAKNSTGCVNRVDINGVRINLWSTATLKTGVQPCTNSSLELAEPLQLSLNGQQYSHSLLVDANVFPIHLNFRTLLPNGQLLLARNSDQATLLEVVLNCGNIVIRVSAGSRRRILTSLELYNNGSSQAVTVMLTESQRGLILLTEKEEIRRGLLNIDTGEVMNYTEVFIGGAPQEIGNELDLSNFTGCARVLTLANPIRELPMCVMDDKVRPCSYCTDQAVLSASFYGASYVEFPSISIGDFFDLTFSLKTAFGDGLIAFTGNASQGNWIAVLLMNSRVTLVFRSGSSGISLPIRSVPLDDDEWHEVTIVRVRSDLNFLIDGISAGGNPFGGLLPSGSLGTNLYIGGISPEAENLLPFGISNEGFKGCLDGVRVLGKPLDFSMNLGLEAVALDVCLRKNGNEAQDVYTFDGSAFATYDLGRFGSNFSVGFQFRTNSSNGLFLFAFSRKTIDALAVQVRDTKVQFYIRSDLMEETEVSVTADVVVSDRQWHTAIVEKSGSTLRVVVDGVEGEETGAPAEELRTNSLLHIGGFSGNIRVPLPAAVTSQRFFGCLRINFLSQSELTNVLTDQCKLLSTR